MIKKEDLNLKMETLKIHFNNFVIDKYLNKFLVIKRTDEPDLQNKIISFKEVTVDINPCAVSANYVISVRFITNSDNNSKEPLWYYSISSLFMSEPITDIVKILAEAFEKDCGELPKNKATRALYGI